MASRNAAPFQMTHCDFTYVVTSVFLVYHLNMRKQKSIMSSRQILGGTPVFCGTRVPVRILLDYLEDGKNIQDFSLDFPSVQMIHAVSALHILKKMLGAKKHARVA